MDLLTQLTQFYVSNQSVASVYLDLRLAEAGAGRDNYLLRWRHLRDELQLANADTEALVRLDNVLAPLLPSGHTAGALAHRNAILRVDIDQPLDCAVAGPLPYGAPILRWLQSRVPYVLARVDRTAAELTAYDIEGRQLRHEKVIGPDDEIERNAPGGWAQARYQHRAEDSWSHNATATAHVLATLSHRCKAQLIAVAGDVRAVQLLGENAPPDVRRVMCQIQRGGGLAADSSQDVQRESIEKLVRETARREVMASVQRLRDVSTAGGTFSCDATVEALRGGAVETLFVHDTITDQRRGWFGDEPTALSLTATLETPTSARLGDVLIRAALGVGTRVVVLDEAIPESADGVAALCRF